MGAVTMMFSLSTVPEIASALGKRLRRLRLHQALTQAELAARAGLSTRAVRNLESSGQATLETFLKVIVAVGRAEDLGPILEVKIHSIRDMERAHRERQRAPRSRKGSH